MSPIQSSSMYRSTFFKKKRRIYIQGPAKVLTLFYSRSTPQTIGNKKVVLGSMCCPQTSKHSEHGSADLLATRLESTDGWIRDHADLSCVSSCARLVAGFCLSTSCWTIDPSSSIGFRLGLFPGHSSFAQMYGRQQSRHHCWALAERCAEDPSCIKLAFDLSAIELWLCPYFVSF